MEDSLAAALKDNNSTGRGTEEEMQNSSDQEFNIPPSWLASSLTLSVQSPAAGNPINAESASTGRNVPPPPRGLQGALATSMVALSLRLKSKLSPLPHRSLKSLTTGLPPGPMRSTSRSAVHVCVPLILECLHMALQLLRAKNRSIMIEDLMSN